MKTIINNIDDKIQVLVTMFIVFFLCTTSLTYIYFSLSDTSISKKIDNSIVNLDLVVDTVLPIENNDGTEGMIAQNITDTNRDILLSASLKNGCIDNLKNVVCQVYKISIKNSSDVVTQVLDGSISFYADADLKTDVKIKNLKWRLIEKFDEKDILNSNLGKGKNNNASFDKNFFIEDSYIGANSNVNYYLLVWVDGENKEVDNMSNYFVKIQFDSSNGTNVTSIFES